MEAPKRMWGSSRLGTCPPEAYEAAWPRGKIADLRTVNPESALGFLT